MNKYVVASISFYDNEIKQSIQESENELKAFKKHQISLCKNQDYLDDEIEWQLSEDYPKTYEDLQKDISNWDMDANVLKIN